MTELVELRIPPAPKFVALARLVVGTAALQAGMDVGRVDDLRIAVSEATANAVNAHQAAGHTSPVVLRFGPDGHGAFGVDVEDTGEGFQPSQRRDFNGRDWATMTGGLGVVLIRGLTDTCEFVHEAGMAVRMRFTIGIHEPAEHDETAGFHSATASASL